jgi:hypothetical protein
MEDFRIITALDFKSSATFACPSYYRPSRQQSQANKNREIALKSERDVTVLLACSVAGHFLGATASLLQ